MCDMNNKHINKYNNMRTKLESLYCKVFCDICIIKLKFSHYFYFIILCTVAYNKKKL